jgi:hypothetical protein
MIICPENTGIIRCQIVAMYADGSPKLDMVSGTVRVYQVSAAGVESVKLAPTALVGTAAPIWRYQWQPSPTLPNGAYVIEYTLTDALYTYAPVTEDLIVNPPSATVDVEGGCATALAAYGTFGVAVSGEAATAAAGLALTGEAAAAVVGLALTGEAAAAVVGLALTGEAAAALIAYDPPTKAELDSAVAPLATATALATIDGNVDAIKLKTNNLPGDPADQSAVEAAITATVVVVTHASMADDGTNARFSVWLERLGVRMTTITGITAEVRDKDSVLVVNLGAGTGPSADGSFSFSCSSTALPFGVPLVLRTTSTDGATTWYGSIGFARS